jgi:hypothetical protein
MRTAAIRQPSPLRLQTLALVNLQACRAAKVLSIIRTAIFRHDSAVRIPLGYKPLASLNTPITQGEIHWSLSAQAESNFCCTGGRKLLRNPANFAVLLSASPAKTGAYEFKTSLLGFSLVLGVLFRFSCHWHWFISATSTARPFATDARFTRIVWQLRAATSQSSVDSCLYLNRAFGFGFLNFILN